MVRASTPLVTSGSAGLYCPKGDFFIDPSKPVERAVLTHVHGDRVRVGSELYYCTEASLPILQRRLPPGTDLRALPYGEEISLGDATVSLHPSGHILGAAQVRIEVGGEVWVVTSDFKRSFDPTCEPFEQVPCTTLVTEATFGLPIFHWEEPEAIMRDILSWWDENRAAGRASVLFCYAMGKAERILAELARFTDRRVVTHRAIESLVSSYRDAGVTMLPTTPMEQVTGGSFAGELLLVPPSSYDPKWLPRLGAHETGLASGWVKLRSVRQQRPVDRYFPLSDHADWNELLRTVQESGAHHVLITHGYAEAFARYLRDAGFAASVLETSFAGEADARETLIT